MKDEKAMFDEVVEHFGTQMEIARQLCVDRAAVTQWRQRGGFPPRRAIQIEALTNGKFKASDIVVREPGNVENL